VRREETGLRHCRCCSASSLTPREKGLFKNAGCCSEKMASPDFIPLGHKGLRPEISFFSEQVALIQRGGPTTNDGKTGAPGRHPVFFDPPARGPCPPLGPEPALAPTACGYAPCEPRFSKAGGPLAKKTKMLFASPRQAATCDRNIYFSCKKLSIGRGIE